MEILDDLYGHGNRLIDFYLQGTAQQVSNPLVINLISPRNREEYTFNGAQAVTINISYQSLGYITNVETYGGNRGVIENGIAKIPDVAGPQGIQGIRGVQGLTGPQGAIGTQGTIGAQGIIGSQGIQGIQGLAGDLTSATYTNLNETTTAVGGIPKGSSFDNISYKELLDRLLYVPTSPKLNLTSNITLSKVSEPGDIQDNVWISAEAIKTYGDIARITISTNRGQSIQKDITDQSDLIATLTGVTIESNSTGNNNFVITAEVVDVNNLSAKATETIQFIYPKFIGRIIGDYIPGSEVSYDSGLDTDIKDYVSKELTGGSVNINPQPLGDGDTRFQKILFLTPAEDPVTSITDSNGYNITTSYTRVPVTLTVYKNGEEAYTKEYLMYYSLDLSISVTNYVITFN